MKAREILLVLGLIAIGVFTYYAKTGRIVVGDDGDGLFWGRTEEFSFEESLDFPAPALAEIQIVNAHGSVDVRGTDTDRITVTLKKVIRRKNREEAAAVAAQLKLGAVRDERRLALSTNRDEFKRRGFDTRFTVVVPNGLAVIVRNSYGEVKVEGTGPTEIVNPHGAVQAGAVSGRLSVEGSYEDVDVHDIRAAAHIAAPHAKIIAVGVAGELSIEGSYEAIFIERAEANVRVEAPHSPVSLKDLKAGAEVRNSYETVTVTGAGAVKVVGHHSDVVAERLAGALDVTDENARLTAVDIAGDLRIEGRNLAVRAERVTGREIFVSTSTENVELIGFSGQATVVLKHGAAVLEPVAFGGPIDIRGDHADVTLGWPAGARTPFEAETRGGSIRWGLADKPALEKANGTSQTKAFPDAAGPRVKIATTYGDIEIVERAKR
jgi:hypothetical protein